MRKQTTILLLLLATLFFLPTAYAGSTSATMNVSVHVTAEDIHRGYVDLPAAVVFQVRSNARNGYALEFEPVSGPFSRAQVNWGNSTAVVGADGTWLTRSRQQGTASGVLDVRLGLT